MKQTTLATSLGTTWLPLRDLSFIKSRGAGAVYGGHLKKHLSISIGGSKVKIGKA